MKFVMDTNVLARAAAGPPGPAYALLRLCKSEHSLVLSPAMLIELSRTMRYERVRAIHGLSDEEIDTFIAALEQAAIMVELPGDSIGHIASDPDDDVVIATALAEKADIICTRDRHLRHPNVMAYCADRGIRVLTDTELLVELRGSAHP